MHGIDGPLPKAQIIVTLTEEGNITMSMTGIATKIDAFGLMEVGRQSIEHAFKQQEDRKVQPVTLLPPGGFRS